MRLAKRTLVTVLCAFSIGQAQNNQAEIPRSLDRLSSRSEFDLLSRQYDRGRFGAMPHVLFVIDRNAGNRVYYVNSKLFRFHRDFVNASYLSLERGAAFYENNYLRSNRRFLLGTIASQVTSNRFTFEFWEGDQLDSGLLELAYQVLRGTFFSPLWFKPNSTEQEQAASGCSTPLPLLTAAEIARDLEYQPLVPGAGIGQLRIIRKIEPDTVIDRNQIVILNQAPIQITPLSGIITTESSSPLSHIAMLARSWGIPYAYIKNADRLFSNLEGKYVRLELSEGSYRIEPADLRDIEERQRQWSKRSDLLTPRADLSYSKLADLEQQRAADVIRFGAKSANLGEVMNAAIPGVTVPPGFTVPFRWYAEFIRRNALEERISGAIEEDRFVHDPAYRRKRLAEIRQWIEMGGHDKTLTNLVLAKVHRRYAGKGLFVRSSTNSEDLPEFSGAGLYTTVPNVRSDDALMKAIKTVWASIWNYEAYEARESFGINHLAVYPAVLIQEGIDADSAGVAITADPFDRSHPGSVYINAKRGLGIKVVEGRRVPEQVIYRPGGNAIQVLTRSEEDTMLKFDAGGGVREISIEARRSVLTDDAVRRLAGAALHIKRVFKGKDQDIEWLYSKGKLFIVQSRPYVVPD